LHKRTGCRKPKNYLKVGVDKDYTKPLTPRLSVGMVDEELPVGKEGGRKSWYLTLTSDLLTQLGPVHGARKRDTILLFEDDVVALVKHVFDAWLIAITDDGEVVNEEAVQYERWERDSRRLVAQQRRKRQQQRDVKRKTSEI
jgi:hypothetical protein